MNNKGFTIIEVLIAMVILGMTLMAATTMLLMTIKLNTTGNMQTMAKNYATSLLEEIKCTESYDLERGVFYDNPHPAFYREWSIEDTGNVQMARIKIMVRWKRFGNTKRFVINTVHKGLFIGGSSWMAGTGNIEDVF